MEKLSHAYIVSSASENARMGKAFYLAEKMLCQSEGERPCGVCRDCRKVKARVHPDLAVVERITDDKGKQKKEILSIRCVQWAPTPTFCRTRPPKRYIS